MNTKADQDNESQDEETIVVEDEVTEQPEAQAAPPAEPVEPTEDERREKFALLKAALKGSLAMHGEDETRKRLQYNKFSEVPFEAIDATIERLEA